MTPNTESLVDRRNREAEETRTKALFQGLSRFPLDGRGMMTVDRYELPDVFLMEALRTMTRTPVISRKTSERWLRKTSNRNQTVRSIKSSIRMLARKIGVGSLWPRREKSLSIIS